MATEAKEVPFPNRKASSLVHSTCSFFLLLVFKAGLSGVDRLAAVTTFLGVSFLLIAIFLLGVVWMVTTESS